MTMTVSGKRDVSAVLAAIIGPYPEIFGHSIAFFLLVTEILAA